MLEVGIRVAAGTLVVLLAALVRGWPALVPASLLLLAGLYVGQLAVDEEALDMAAGVVAAGLLVTAELAYWSLEEREAIVTDPGERLRHVAFVALHGLGALVVGLVLLTLVDAVRTRGLAVDLVGAIAAAAVLLAVVLFARSQSRPSP